MACICPKCDTAHGVNETCEEAAKMSEKFGREVERHQEDCDHCETFEDAYWHLLRKRQGGSSY